ncbi:hypothetical protein DL89DRAFT_270284 [Linderina pennispora]|uniref:Secreted protein n=1 Tax=Linderina pennispora TaxID=61395 RepID=A0A1Y1VYM4_9FUNG|nr:uncharacterized protein DL89DRAFT_270284 [Linderina pennispora]ORX66368.1 hypothetical protein DL89DRAFT_270284 [Linderina pennispora]
MTACLTAPLPVLLACACCLTRLICAPTAISSAHHHSAARFYAHHPARHHPRLQMTGTPSAAIGLDAQKRTPGDYSFL